jgi:hypothetical protein
MTAKFGCPVRLYPFWFWPKSPVTGAFGYGWFKYIPFIHGEKDMRARDAWSKAHPSDYMTPPYMEDFGSDSKPAAPAKPADPAIQASTAPTATVNVIPPPPVTSNLAKKAEEELLIQSTIDASKKKKEQQLVAALAIGAVALIWWTRKNKKRK